MVRFRLIGLPAALVVIPSAAMAQNVIDQIVGGFQSASAGWEAPLQTMAQGTFGILAMIQFCWGMAKLTVRRADFSEFTAELVNQIMFLGLFFWLLTTTTTWGPLIIKSFRQAGATASGTAVLSPGDVFNAGVSIAQTVLSQMSIWSPAASAGLMLAAIVIIVVFALMCAEMVIALVRSFFITTAGVLFMAFGGTMWSSEIAIAVVRKVLSVGAGLFTLQLILSIGTNFIQQWVAQFQDVTAISVLTEIGSAVVLLAVSWVIPNDIASLIGAGAFAHGGALWGAAAATAGGAVAVGSGALRVATGIAGAGTAAGSAARLAGAQMSRRAALSTAPSSTAGRLAFLTGRTVSNLAGAAKDDIGRRLSGQSPRRGVAGFRLAANMRQQREEL